MSVQTQYVFRADPMYPDSDGLPMSDNTLQFEWIVRIKENLEAMFKDRDDVFVAGDLLWYAVEGNPKIRTAPDALVVFGRPKGYRGSYKQWDEENVPPQVVFEVLSPGNRPGKMNEKFRFYERHGVEEYYLYDPDGVKLTGWHRQQGALVKIAEINGWTSPLLGIQFTIDADDLTISRPDGGRFQSFLEAEQRLEDAERERDEEREKAEEQRERAEAERRKTEEQRERAEAERRKAEEQRERAEAERQKAEEQRERAERLAARLRELGVDPES